MEKVIQKWELILQQDSGNDITYSRKVIQEILHDIKQAEVKIISSKHPVSGQVCDHYWRDNVTIGEPIVTCIHCGKTDIKQTCH